MKNTNIDLLQQLELTYSYLKEDIKALGYLQDDYFISNKPIEDFECVYFKLQNLLSILIKSMQLNELQLKTYIDNSYKSSN